MNRISFRLWIIVLTIVFAQVLVVATTVHADPVGPCGSDTRGCAKFVPLAEFQGSPKLASVYDSADLGTFINRLFFTAISAGAILAVLRLSWAGYQYMGSDLWGNKEHAKEIISDTFLGLFLLLSVYLILHQINPDILNLNATRVMQQNPIPTTPAGSSTGSSSASNCNPDGSNAATCIP